MAKKAWDTYLKDHTVASTIAVANLTHPTFPESAGGTGAAKKLNTKKMLQQWNAALPALHTAVQHKDASTALVLFGDAFVESDKVDIPSFDLPAGIPGWMYDNDGWARRIGTTTAKKRANITIDVPASALP